MAKALDELRERKDVYWTYISPAGDFQAEGEKTGEYILGGEELTLNEKGESVISYGDYAVQWWMKLKRAAIFRRESA